MYSDIIKETESFKRQRDAFQTINTEVYRSLERFYAVRSNINIINK